MGRVFLNKQYSNYLGENRAILDIIVGFVPDPITPTPTPTPSITPSNTATPNPTATPTPSNTPSVTPSPQYLCNSFVSAPQTINGITITESYSGSATPYIFSPQICCGGSVIPPSGGLYVGNGGIGTCPPPVYPFSYTLNFTSGVNNIDIVIYGGGCAGGLNEELFYFTCDSGIVNLSSVGTNCFTTITGNTVAQGLGCCSGITDTPFVKLNVSAPSNFTSLTITGDGGYRGSVIGLCADSIPFPTTPTNTPSNTPSTTPSVTPSNTPSVTPSITATNTPTNTPSNTPSVTPSITATNTPSVTPSVTASNTPSVTPSITASPTTTPTTTLTATPTQTPSETPTNTPTGTPTQTPTQTPSPTSLPVNCSWSGASISWENDTNLWSDCLPNPTPTPTASNTPTPSITPSITASPTLTPTPSSTELGINKLLAENLDHIHTESDEGLLIES